jgi:hypothetical protein
VEDLVHKVAAVREEAAAGIVTVRKRTELLADQSATSVVSN